MRAYGYEVAVTRGVSTRALRKASATFSCPLSSTCAFYLIELKRMRGIGIFSGQVCLASRSFALPPP